MTASVTGNTFPVPLSLVPDLASAGPASLALAQNINYTLACGFTSVNSALTLAQIFAAQIAAGGVPTLQPGVLRRFTTPPTGNNDQLPTAAQVIVGVPNTLPRDGTLQFESRIVNDGTGQTITLTTNTGLTLTGTMTIANNAWRDFMITINVGAGTYELTNIGGGTL